MAFSLLLAGCSDDAAEPQPLPSVSASTPVTTDSLDAANVPATSPVMPAAAMGTSAASAKEFVRYWIAVLNYSGPAGESTRLRELSSPQCLDCDAIADLIDIVTREGGYIRGHGWTIRNSTVNSGKPKAIRIDTIVIVHPQTVLMKRDSRPRRFPGGRRVAKVFYVTLTGNQWLVGRLDQHSA